MIELYITKKSLLPSVNDSLETIVLIVDAGKAIGDMAEKCKILFKTACLPEEIDRFLIKRLLLIDTCASYISNICNICASYAAERLLLIPAAILTACIGVDS